MTNLIALYLLENGSQTRCLEIHLSLYYYHTFHNCCKVSQLLPRLLFHVALSVSIRGVLNEGQLMPGIRRKSLNTSAHFFLMLSFQRNTCSEALNETMLYSCKKKTEWDGLSSQALAPPWLVASSSSRHKTIPQHKSLLFNKRTQSSLQSSGLSQVPCDTDVLTEKGSAHPL